MSLGHVVRFFSILILFSYYSHFWTTTTMNSQHSLMMKGAMGTSSEQRGDEEQQWGLETQHISSSSSRYVVFFFLFFYSINNHLPMGKLCVYQCPAVDTSKPQMEKGPKWRFHHLGPMTTKQDTTTTMMNNKSQHWLPHHHHLQHVLITTTTAYDMACRTTTVSNANKRGPNNSVMIFFPCSIFVTICSITFFHFLFELSFVSFA